jgi:PAS domain S-box-containing protein
MSAIMVPPSGSKLDAQWEDDDWVVSRIHRNGDSRLLVRSRFVERPETLASLERVYELRDVLDPAWATRPLSLVRQDGGNALLLEDPGGEFLSTLVERPWELRAFLRVAIGIADALCQLHKQGIMHKDVNPAHILVDVGAGKAWLTGFSIASKVPRERQPPPDIIAGSLAYMAPEQTGRMNRSVDSRSDLYAFGVTLYQMLTGELPFTAADATEWIHSHVARAPKPPGERVQGIPAPVEGIVLKLLSKTAEHRYQTAAGAEEDLRRCLTELESSGRVDPFPLASQDVHDRLLIPERLYGRERDVDTLLAAFERFVAKGTPELILVCGDPGIGKSSVVNELHKSLTVTNCLFASGKFDQYKRDIPYATFAQALRSVVLTILSQSDAELSKWRDSIGRALGPHGQLIANLIPEIELIVGKQPPVPELPPQEAKNRFEMVFRRLLGVVATQEHPLALFLDDLQWLDAATLDLLEHVVTHPEVRHLLVIGAYRDNEVGEAHALSRTLERIKAAGARVNVLHLAPLGVHDVGRLLADALVCDVERVQPLSQLVHEKTGGNPFFTIQFVAALADGKLITFDPTHPRWMWDLPGIHARNFTDNIADLMVDRLARLSIATRDALKDLSCLGNSAPTWMLGAARLPDLRRAMGCRAVAEAAVHGALSEAVSAGLVVHQGGTYSFLHDRIQEASYALIPEGDRAGVHLSIGRAFLARTPVEKRDDAIFDIVHQLNRGATLIASPEERREVAGLNLIAGKRARSAAAYVSALSYFNSGAALLPEDSWERCYELVFGIELARAECQYLSGFPEVAEDRLSILSRRAANLVDIAAVTCLRAAVYTTLDRSDRAVEVDLAYLRHVGIDWSLHPTGEEVRQEHERMWRQIGSRPIEALFDLPSMSDPDRRATMDVLAELIAPAYFSDENLFSLTLLRMANLSIEHGNTDGSCYAYVCLNTVVGSRFGDYRAGFRFGELSLDLVEKRGLDRFKARVYNCFGGMVIPWMKHLRTARPLVRRALAVAEEAGDLTFAVFSLYSVVTNLLISGDPLGDVQREAENGLEFGRKARFGFAVLMLTGPFGLVRTLRGLTRTFGCFDDDQFDESRFEQLLESSPQLAVPTCWYWIRKLQARFHAGDYAAALAAAAKARQLFWITASFIEEAEYVFYAALAFAASCDSATADQRSRYLEMLLNHHKRLVAWAENCPENFGNRAALVAAELARLEGRELDAERLYEDAIRLARADGFIQNEAIANELAAGFYAARGFDTIARCYLRSARAGYLRWGALGKVAQLDERQPGIEEPTPPGPTTTVGQLDLATVIEVSQAASGEILLEKLIETVMVHAIEHAGAERGLLILLRNDEPWIEAEATTDQDRVTVSLRHAAVSAGDLPESMLRYVIRTRENVILDDASTENLFSADEYIRQKRSRSVLCLPLIIVKPGDRAEKRATLCGVLYLENNLASHVFTPARTAVLKVLASQAAISLDNAHLYADLKAAEEKTRQAEQQVRRVVDTIPALVWTASPDGLVNYYSQRLVDYTGRSQEDELGWGWTASVHPDDLELVQASWQRALAEGTPSEVEARVRRADGRYRWFLGRSVPLRDSTGQITGWYGTATDIEDRKQAEQSLRRSEAYLAQAQRLSHTGSFGVRLSGAGIGGLLPVWQGVWSKETFRLLGLDEASKPSLETVLQHTHPDDVALVRRAVDQAAQSRAGMDFEHRLVMSDGSVKHVHVVADAVMDDSGNVELVGAVQDITSSKKAFEEIRALRDQLYQENVALREEVDKASMFEDIVGSSPPLQAVLSRVSKVAPTDSTAFITGETGTGKELIARAIHRRSPRSSRAFVAVNCAVIPKDLIASELFGHEKGAFTGAMQRHVGRFELAEGGTLFLDEVGEIPPDTQVALLRVLQERRFERVGGSQCVQVDVRVIAATNKELEAAMNAGSFRRDLFYRLNVFPIQVPSLRERREDIPLLVEYFIERFATQAGKRFSRINKKSLDLLRSYHWPGNIRELQNVIERSVILCETKEFAVDEHWLVPGPVAMEPKKRTLGEQVIGEEKKIIEAALAETGGKVAGPSGAAVKLGMHATTLYSKINSLKIDKRSFKRS